METQILISLIERSGLSQRQFAEKFERSETNISGWVNGTRKPKMSTLIKMAETLGFEIILSFDIKKL